MKLPISGGRLAWIAAAALVLAACGGASGEDKDEKGKDGEDKEKAEEVAIPVEAGVAKRQRIVASYTGTATLEAEREAQVVAKTSGVLLKLRVEEGDRVREGQVLAEIDPERARLELQRATSTLKRLENDNERSKELFGRQLVSQEANDKVRFELDTQRAATELAQLELSYTRIVAPIDGVISERMVKEGNLIQLHQALFRIDDFDPLLGVLNVPERELSTLKPGLPVSMAVDAMPGKRFTGTVARVSPVVDPATGTFRVTAEFHDETLALKSGMFGRLDIVYDEREDALVIPREALMEEDGATSVFVAEKDTSPPKKPDPKAEKAKKDAKPDKAKKPAGPPPVISVAKRRKVTIGHSTGDIVEIREGLKEGDKVITVGRAAVRDGTKVQVLESTP